MRAEGSCRDRKAHPQTPMRSARPAQIWRTSNTEGRTSSSLIPYSGSQVMNVKWGITAASITLWMLACSLLIAEDKPRSLFNSENLKGWHADIPELDEKPDSKSAFTVRDGKLVSLGKPGGHLITDDSFADYRLEVEYR